MNNLSVKCLACRQKLGLKVCQSAAGFYLGHRCSQCGPHDRQSGYYASASDAGLALNAVLVESDLLDAVLLDYGLCICGKGPDQWGCPHCFPDTSN